MKPIFCALQPLSVVAGILLACGIVTAQTGPVALPDGLVIKANMVTELTKHPAKEFDTRFFLRRFAEHECQNWEQDYESPDECEEAWFDELETKPRVAGYTISIKGQRMRVDSEGLHMLAALAADGSIAEWGLLDPKTNRVNAQASDVFNNNTKANKKPSVYGLGEIITNKTTFEPTGQTKAMLGLYTARRYTYTHIVAFKPLKTAGEATTEFGFELKGEAWIAELGPYAADPRVAGVARVIAESIGNQGFGSFGTSFAKRGMVLATSDETDFYIKQVDATSEGKGTTLGRVSLERFSSAFTVTDICAQSLDDELFSGFERGEKKCDCSCKGWTDLQAVKKNPEDPRAMELAMCSPQCMSKWWDSKCFK